MDSAIRKRLIDVAAKREPADLVISDAQVVNVFTGAIERGDVAIVGDLIAGIGNYTAETYIDAAGRYLLPGLIDAHVHIESSLVDPASFAQLTLPHGTTTVIADPHEIANVCGLEGIDYMLGASEGLAQDVFFMLPSCVPATPFEHAGAILDAKALAQRIAHPRILGLGEMMDMVGTVSAESHILDKIAVAERAGKLIDGHAPNLSGSDLAAYIAAGIHTDHECATIQEMHDRIARGMYVLLREGSACKDLRNLLPGVTPYNAHRCLFCTDDRQPSSILEDGHIDNHLRIAVSMGLDPILAIRMATLNAAQCYHLHDRGAVAPGRKADMILVNNLKDFTVSEVITHGVVYRNQTEKQPLVPSVFSRVNIGSFTQRSLQLPLQSSRVHVIGIQSGSVVTSNEEATVSRDAKGNFISGDDVVKLAVIERHHGTGTVGLALLRGYGITEGAVATTIAHDSHNIIVSGDNDEDMALAVQTVQRLGGGIVMVHQHQVLDALPLPIAGLMTNEGASFVDEKLKTMQALARNKLHIHDNIDPFMTLSFMALPVIPHLKVTDMGLFDVDQFTHISLEIT
jgi:adenine deaminase